MLPSLRGAPIVRGSAGIVFVLVLVSTVGCHRRAYIEDGKREVSRVEELLEGRPGVEVLRTADGGYSVRIRGVGSFMSSEEPLWVVDGVPVDLRGRGLSWLNPADVARIEVLKNATDTAIYGVRGSNGVIVITTKRPR